MTDLNPSRFILAPQSAGGQSLQEYAVIFGLVVIVGVGGLMATGQQVSGMMNTNNQNLFENGSPGKPSLVSLTNFLTTPTYKNPTTLFLFDPTTNQLTIKPGDDFSPEKSNSQVHIDNTNTTSAEGSQVLNTVLGSSVFAQTIDQMAQQNQGSEPVRKYVQNLADECYQLASFQGQLDQMLASKDGSNAAVLQEMLNHAASLNKLLQDSPKDLTGEERAMTLALANQVLLISHSYLEAFQNTSGLVENNVVKREFEVKCPDCRIRAAKPGYTLQKEIKISLTGETPPAKPVDSTALKMEQIKKTLNNLLAQNQINEKPVEVSLSNAKQLDNKAKNKTDPGPPASPHGKPVAANNPPSLANGNGSPPVLKLSESQSPP